MKILNLCITDTGASGYALSHALNKLPKENDVQSICLRTSNSWVNYPSMAEIKNYGEENCRKMVEAADVIVFHSTVRPFYTALHLDTDKLKVKKKFLYFHGSECRNYGAAIMKDAADVMHDDYQMLLSTPDLLQFVPTGHWLPVARDFEQIKNRYGMTHLDRTALENWGALVKKTVVAHAPTNEELKGSPVFYSVITELIQEIPTVEFSSIKDVPWDTCLRMLSDVAILYDQHVLGCYGLISVEAAIFGAAVFCKLQPEVCTLMEKESGLPQPFIQWIDKDELRTQSFMLVQEPKLQEKFGQMANVYCQKMHDDLNVAHRFMKIVEAS
jgi:hypothetical protein